MAPQHYIGVDVGTGSVRAGVVSHDGRILHTHTEDVTVNNPRPGFYHQSTDEVWKCVASCIKKMAGEAGLENGGLEGIGFASTCSLVLVDGEGNTIRWAIVMF